MQRVLLITVALVWACDPHPAAVVPTAATGTVAAEMPHADPCKRGIPDCEAACALRETGRTDYVDWYDRRCAAAILGSNPDHVPQAPPRAVATTNPGPGVCDPPFTLDPDGHKKWKAECLDSPAP